MSTLHKSSEDHLVPKEEQPGLLCSNKVSDGCSSLEFPSNDLLPTEDILLDQFAELMVEIYLELKGYKEYDEECCNILPGINKRAG